MNIENVHAHQAFLDSYERLKGRVQAIAEGREVAEPVMPARRMRSLQTCQRYRAQPELAAQSGRESKAYVPELSARLEEDHNLTDGARRCGRKIAELAYRTAREDRRLAVTVSYLARGLGRCTRTVQRYLRQLEAAGYIRSAVVMSGRSRMTFGLVISLLRPLFAAHHGEKWPGSLRKPGVTAESQNKRFISLETKKRYCIPVDIWSQRCMDGVARSLQQFDLLRRVTEQDR